MAPDGGRRDPPWPRPHPRADAGQPVRLLGPGASRERLGLRAGLGWLDYEWGLVLGLGVVATFLLVRVRRARARADRVLIDLPAAVT